MGHRPKRGGATSWQILDIELFCKFPSTPSRYGDESSGFGKVMKLSFEPYKEHPKGTPYVTVASFLVQTVSGIRKRNEGQLEDDSDFNVYVSNVVMCWSSSPSWIGVVLDSIPSSNSYKRLVTEGYQVQDIGSLENKHISRQSIVLQGAFGLSHKLAVAHVEVR